MKRKLLTTLLLSAIVVQGYSKDENPTVTINYTVQRYLGDVTSLTRGKFFNIHSSADGDADVDKFMADYGVGLGRGFWGPLQANPNKEAGVYPEPGLKGVNTTVKPVTGTYFISTEHPVSVETPTLVAGMDTEAAADWCVEWFNNYTDTVPALYEPLNEPFVHADEFGVSSSEMITTMTNLFEAIGRKVKADPYLTNMKVIGFADAYPSYEVKDFELWNTRMGYFMDNAGAQMDAFSVHLYDGINITGKDTRRSGSNSEAVLDMVEAYSFIKWGYVKPHAGSEFGGIDDTYGDAFNEGTAYNVLPSINHLLFNYIEREDVVEVAIPFIGDKSTWYITADNNYGSYCASMFMPTNPYDLSTTTWELNDKKYLFELWKGVKGDRVEIVSDNLDVQVLAFRDGSTLYIALDNLLDEPQSVTLNSGTNWGDVSGVVERKFSVDYDSGTSGTTSVSYDAVSHGTMPSSITMNKNGTTVIVATIGGSSLEFSNTVRRKKYYSTDFLQKVQANNTMEFNVPGVDVSKGFGRATVRMSYGVDMTNSNGYTLVKPTSFMVNGTEVDFPDNWRGYNQKGRDDFFGTFEIDVDFNLLRSGDNTVSVKYSSTGGYIACMAIQVEQYDQMPDEFSSSIQNGTFESASLSNWIPYGRWGNAVLDGETVLSGSKSLKVSGESGVIQNLEVDASYAYELSASVKSSQTGSVRLAVTDSTGAVIKEEEFTVTSVAQSVRLSVPSVGTAGQTAKVSVAVGSTSSSQITWIDNINFISSTK